MTGFFKKISLLFFRSLEISQGNLHFWLLLEHQGLSQPWASFLPGQFWLEWEEPPWGAGAGRGRAWAVVRPAHLHLVILCAQGPCRHLSCRTDTESALSCLSWRKEREHNVQRALSR